MTTEIAANADFSTIRYAQCWEDADVLLKALAIRPGDVCLSIASAGDNCLAMLAHDPSRVIALDISPAQLYCLELRIAAYRNLEHPELLELIGSRPSIRRLQLYQHCRPSLSQNARCFWDERRTAIEQGIGSAGKFERYFSLFRRYILPLIHGRTTVVQMLRGGNASEREAFYSRIWDNRRWRLLFRLFFSRLVMGRLGRDPSFFRYVEGGIAERLMERTRHALVALNPKDNPYLHWIVTGRHGEALPFALRAENFATIRNNLDRLEWRCCALEDFLSSNDRPTIQRFNLSDIFEYMAESQYLALLRDLVSAASPGARLVYWNLLAPRRRPQSMAEQLHSLDELAVSLHGQDKAFFYGALIVEEVF
ncbi:BtaA family protein [Methylomonas sp. SURF-1]|uniref:BtaA family protein n=1 Tax=Methylomonas aurea TaxID=2952224 RepID=A0ABT1UBZ4_9GAMM|nr:DUF3419 family protein [Methylomonas sp. SURF-1]MCQ8179754.1 BtaA family protein [Methylomonas sp. SURF-1]